MDHIYAFRDEVQMVARLERGEYRDGTAKLIGTVPFIEVPALATELMATLDPHGALGYVITCPICGSGLIRIAFTPGTPDVRYLPNGDPGYPGDPSMIEGVEGSCNCWTPELKAKVFGGLEYQQWYCFHEVNPPAGRPYRKDMDSPVEYRCMTYVRVGNRCPNCGCEQDASAAVSTATEDHPIYTALEQIIASYDVVSGFFEAQAMEAMYEEDERAMAAVQDGTTLDGPEESEDS